MPSSLRSRLAHVPSLPFTLFTAYIFLLFIAGGSARADVPGQVVVRVAATLVMIISVLFCPRPELNDIRPVWFALMAAIALPVLQLIPLPPGLWQGLPGRSLLLQAASNAGEPQPWRPLSMVPGATINAAGSLLVPLATLLLLSQLKEYERRRVPHVVVSLIAVSMIVGLMQFSGLNVGAPFGDNGPVEVSGLFNNRNHFALLLGIGCVVTPVWAFMGTRQQKWRIPVALALIVLFALSILASGSRAGLFIGVAALGLGMIIVRREIGSALARYPRWVAPATISAIVTIIAAVISLSFVANRAMSINRILTIDAAQDMRTRAFPTVMKLFETYFPAGAGYGTFDPVFRIHEPLALLSPEYFNHAHNDLLEIAIDGGAIGLAVLSSALIWWAIASFRAWHARSERHASLAQAGSATILLTILASTVDYPGRTPLIMAILTIAAAWLAGKCFVPTAALPQSGRHL